MISIVIPLYNRSWSICRALDSACKYLDYINDGEIIIINDGSTDNSLQVIEDYIHNNYTDEGFIKVISYKTNRGVCHARNIGVKKANNDWILFLDSDDELINTGESSFKIISNYLNDGDVHFFACVNDKNEIVGSKLPGSNKVSLDNLIIKGTRGESIPIIKKSLLLKYPYEEDLLGMEGLTYLKMVKERGYATLHSIPLRKYFENHSDRLSSNNQMLMRSYDIYLGYKRMLKLFYKDIKLISLMIIFLKFIKSYARYKLAKMLKV